MNAVTRSNEPALYIYLSRSVPGKGYRSVDAGVHLVDGDGCVFDPTQSGGWDDGLLKAPAGPGGMKYSVGWYRFEAFPRREKKLHLVIGNNSFGSAPSANSQASVEMFIANPAPPPAATNWPIEPVPLTRIQGNVSFILTGVGIVTNRATVYSNGKSTKVISAEYEFVEDGQPSREWQAVSTELYDSTGNFIAEKFAPYHSLCPREPAWKLKVRFFGTEKSRAASNTVWTLKGLKVPGAGESIPIGQSNLLQGVLVSMSAFGGPGDFTYSNGVALKAAPSKDKQSDYASIVSLNHWTGKNSIAKPTFALHAQKPHVAIELGDLSDDQKFTARAMDDRGREFYAHKVTEYYPQKPSGPARFLSNWYDSEGGFLVLDLPDDVKTVDLIFCVHACRRVEYIFKPLPSSVASDK